MAMFNCYVGASTCRSKSVGSVIILNIVVSCKQPDKGALALSELGSHFSLSVGRFTDVSLYIIIYICGVLYPLAWACPWWWLLAQSFDGVSPHTETVVEKPTRSLSCATYMPTHTHTYTYICIIWHPIYSHRVRKCYARVMPSRLKTINIMLLYYNTNYAVPTDYTVGIIRVRWKQSCEISSLSEFFVDIQWFITRGRLRSMTWFFTLSNYNRKKSIFILSLIKVYYFTT